MNLFGTIFSCGLTLIWRISEHLQQHDGVCGTDSKYTTVSMFIVMKKTSPSVTLLVIYLFLIIFFNSVAYTVSDDILILFMRRLNAPFQSF